MKHWTLGKRITTGFAGVIIITLVLGAFAYTRQMIIKSHADQMATESLPAMELVYRAQSNARTCDQIVYKHIGSTSQDDMARLETELGASISDNDKVYAELEKLIPGQKEHDLFENVKTARAAHAKVRNVVIAISREGTNNPLAYATARAQLDPSSDQYLAALMALINSVRIDSETTSSGIQSTAQSAQTGILIGLTLATLAGISVALVIIRGTGIVLNRIASALDDGSNQVASAAGQVASASQSLAHGSGEQAASIEETSSSLEELASMTKRNAENAQKANDLAKQARQAADKGFTDMHDMSSAMNAIKVASDDIAKIIKTIDEIAFQTNILALNAAVEAARAGEAGMGFAVVADEVRNLAQRSAQAAKETAAKIEGAINKTAQGVGISNKVAQTLAEIVSKARQVDELASEVAGASREQTQGITQINTAVGQMDKVTQSNAASAEQSAAAAQELNAQASMMKRSVGELLKLMSGNREDPGSNVAETKVASKIKTPFSTPTKRGTTKTVNGNGHHPVSDKAEVAARRHEIPMGDFKDF